MSRKVARDYLDKPEDLRFEPVYKRKGGRNRGQARRWSWHLKKSVRERNSCKEVRAKGESSTLGKGAREDRRQDLASPRGVHLKRGRA